jgi:hypothetical protein
MRVISQSECPADLWVARADLLVSRSGAGLGDRRRGRAELGLVPSPLVARDPREQPASFEPPRRSFLALAQPRGEGRHGVLSSFNTSSFCLQPSFYHGLLKNDLLLINDRGFRAKLCKTLRLAPPGRPHTQDAGGIDDAMRYQPELEKSPPLVELEKSPPLVPPNASACSSSSHTNPIRALGGYK